MRNTTDDAARVRTGIAGFDEIADQGLPRGGLTVVVGGPGAGKTIFGMQVLAHGAEAEGEPGILVAFEESAERIAANISGFVWGREAGRRVQIVDAEMASSVEQGGEFDLIGLLAMVGAKAVQAGARRIVFDGIDVLLGYLGEASLIRRELFRLREWVHKSGLSAIVTAKADFASAHTGADFDVLQFMADCVVTLSLQVVHGTALRFIRVAKYRGSPHSASEFPITITGAGIEVATNTGSGLGFPAPNERVSTGIERLDVMLAGGYYRGSSVLITGVPGTAKTSLAAAFAEAAARRGERTLYVSFDESPAQIVRNVASIGIQLAPHVQSGVLRLHSLRGRAESSEAQVARIRALLREAQPSNLVVDPLSGLERRGRAGEAVDAALQVLDITKLAGITTVSTSLLGNSLPNLEETPLDISTIADTWMHLSYVIQGGERNRALTIIKSRGTGHSNQVRELILSGTGVTLADVYSVGGEVLMGTLRWEKETQARRAREAARDEAVLREHKAALALAETQTKMELLAREQALQETELRRIRASTAHWRNEEVMEEGELRQRRRADTVPVPPPSPHRVD